MTTTIETGKPVDEVAEAKKAEARSKKLWKKLRETRINFYGVVVEIVKEKAYYPYKKFSEAWAKEMPDVRIPVELMGIVVYTLLDEGVSDDEIIDLVEHLGKDTLESLKLEKADNVKPEKADKNRVSRAKRLAREAEEAKQAEAKKAEEAEKAEKVEQVKQAEKVELAEQAKVAPWVPSWNFGQVRQVKWEAIAATLDTTVEELAVKALDEFFDGLAEQQQQDATDA